MNRFINCEACQTEGRILTNNGGPDETDHGVCPECNGERVVEVETQHATHIIDYGCWTALKHLRDIGACDRRADRKLTDDQWDDNQFSIENGDGGIY